MRAELRIEERTPTPEEYNSLRLTVGWGGYDAAVTAAGLARSVYCVCARSGEDLLGMARVVGDGALTFYVQDVVVLPEHQGHGIGAMLMESVMRYVREHASHNSVVGLMAAKGKEGFYERYGFTRRPNEKLGSGMTILWKREG